MPRDRKLLEVVGQAGKPLTQRIAQNVENVLRACFPQAPLREDIANALHIGADVAGVLREEREAQRTEELETYYEICAAEVAHGGTPGAQAPAACDTHNTARSEARDNLSILPITKSAAELEDIFSQLHGRLGETQTQLQSVEAQLKDAEFQARAHIDGVSLQLRTTTRKVERLEGAVSTLTAEKADLITRSESMTVAMDTTRQQNTRLSGQLEEAQGAIRRHGTELSTATGKSFRNGLLVGVLVAVLVVGALVVAAMLL